MPPKRSMRSTSAYETRIVSAHRTPERLYAFAKGAKAEGFKIIIAGAGGAAHLPGMTASLTSLPVFGVPVESKALSGQDSLYSIVQMPPGVPVGTLAIGQAGAINAALLAASVLALSDADFKQAARSVAGAPDRRRRRSAEGRRVSAASPALEPGATIGILGGGQLGRMLALAAARLGLKCHVFSPNPDSPAFDVVHRVTCADYTDTDALERFAADVDVVTYEFENVPAEAATFLAARVAGAARPENPGDHPGSARREKLRHGARHPHRAVRRRRVGRRPCRGDRADRPAGGSEDAPLRL